MKTDLRRCLWKMKMNERVSSSQCFYYFLVVRKHIEGENTRAEDIGLRPPRRKIEQIREEERSRRERRIRGDVPSANKANITYPAIIIISNRTTTRREWGREGERTIVDVNQ